MSFTTFNKFIAHDAGEMQDAISGADFHHHQLSRGKLVAELWNLQNPRSSIFVGRYNQTLRLFGQMPGDGYPLLLFPGRPKTEGHANGRLLSQQSLAMFGLNGEVDALLPTDFECFVLKVPEALLHHVAETMGIQDRSLTPQNGPIREGEPQAIKSLSEHFRALLRTAEATQGTDSFVLSEDAEEDLIAEYLNCLVQSTDNPPVDRWRKRYEVARRTDDYLRANLHRPVKITELCRELGVSRRLLHYAMTDIYQVPPNQYHLRLRLQYARSMLLSSLNRLTILEISIRSGFSNAGHFSNYYKAMFGESPSATRGVCVRQTLS
jgi:AraC family ethanolamine operon transcriptional activator